MREDIAKLPNSLFDDLSNTALGDIDIDFIAKH